MSSILLRKSLAVFSGSIMLGLALRVQGAFASEVVVHDVEHGAVEHAESSGLPQMDVTTFSSQIFWLVITFAILYFILSKKILPDISGIIENRKNHIESDLETAEKLTAEADSVHDTYQAGLTKAQGKAAKAVQDVEDNMKAKTVTAFDDFKAHSAKEIKAAEDRIKVSKISAMDDMNVIAAEAAAEAVEKIIGKNADANKVKAIVESMNGKAKAA